MVRLPKMGEKEIETLISRQNICRIAFNDSKYPYMAPFQYVRIDGALYFHFTDYGRKMRLLGKDSRVCVGIERFEPDLSEYNFIVLRGKLRLVDDPSERARAIEKMADEGRSLSTNFLAAHGFESGSDWSSFTPDKPITIVKLDEVDEVIGLRSPQHNRSS